MIDIEKLFQVNNRVEIAKLNTEDMEDPGPGQSLIQEIEDDDFLVLIPTVKGRDYFLEEGDQVMVWLKVNNTRFAFESVVLDKKQKNDIKYLVLKKPVKLISSNRRNFVRIKTRLTAHYQIISHEEVNDWENIEPFKRVYLIDLSGQGLSLSLSLPLLKDVMLVLKLRLEHLDVTVKLLGRVVRCEKQGNSYKVGVEFQNISERQQDQIVKYVFYMLRKQIQAMRDY
ncbi:MAG: flagellar brake protein [Syntrophomonadaceae bacterium]|nr:flagellar brake protein [Syntrophomonadaceae bacterium]